jgi:hypothetical protein
MPSPASGPGKPIVDKFGGNRRKLGDVRPLPVKPGKSRGARPLPIDEKIVRTMPITEKQLGQIKRAYGVK